MPGLNLIRRRPWFAPKPRPCEDERRLFRLENGTRLSFYIRPGLTKMELAPLILRRGGKLCSAPEPEAILLACPGEVPEGATKVYISTSYVTDCIAQKTRLPLVKYLLNPQRSPSEPAFTREEDRAIMLYVQSSKQRGLADNLAGTTFWMDMAEARVTPHPWQAVRERYLRHLRRRRRRKKKNTYQPGQNPKRIVPGPHRCGKCAGKEQVLRTPNTASSQNKKPTDASQTRDPGQTTGASKTSGIFQRANREFEGSEGRRGTLPLARGHPGCLITQESQCRTELPTELSTQHILLLKDILPHLFTFSSPSQRATPCQPPPPTWNTPPPPDLPVPSSSMTTANCRLAL